MLLLGLEIYFLSAISLLVTGGSVHPDKDRMEMDWDKKMMEMDWDKEMQEMVALGQNFLESVPRLLKDQNELIEKIEAKIFGQSLFPTINKNSNQV